MFPITSWLRVYFALEQVAVDSRGFIELQQDEDTVIRWPRTIGADVIAIAAIFDPYVREQPLRFGGHGLARRWRACIDDIERHALVAPLVTYVDNRTFWRTLPSVCSYLHSVDAPLPEPTVWQALFASLEAPSQIRNGDIGEDGPFRKFDAKTYIDLYLEQFKHLQGLHGADKMQPEAGMRGAEKLIPRSTNGEVIALADYWGKQLGDVKHVMGHATVLQRWTAALAEVDKHARGGDPTAVYPKNNNFWRELSAVVRQVSAADAAPSTSDIVLDSLKDSVVKLPETLKDAAVAVVGGTAELASNVVQGATKVVTGAGKGLFSGLGAPLLIGGGLLGLFLMSRTSQASRDVEPTEE